MTNGKCSLEAIDSILVFPVSSSILSRFYCCYCQWWL